MRLQECNALKVLTDGPRVAEHSGNENCCCYYHSPLIKFGGFGSGKPTQC